MMDETGLSDLLHRADTLRTTILPLNNSYSTNLTQFANQSEAFGAGSLFDGGNPSGDGPITGSGTTGELPLTRFLREEREKAVLSLVQETLTQTMEDARKNSVAYFMDDWNDYKKKLVGGGPTVILPDSQSHAFNPGQMPGNRSQMTQLELQFAGGLSQLTTKQLQGGICPPYLPAFKQISVNLKENDDIFVWEQVEAMSELCISPGCDILAERDTQKVERDMIKLALKYLHNNMLQHMKRVVEGNLSEARLGGVPGTDKLVVAYLNLMSRDQLSLKQDEIYFGQCVWRVLYLCLRAGDCQSAIRVSSSMGVVLADITAVLQEFAAQDGKLSLDLITKLRLEYRRSLRSDAHAYKRAVYCVLAPCDVGVEQNDVSDAFEDWLWMGLIQAQHLALSPQTSEKECPQGSLKHLIKLFATEYGEDWFAGKDPSLYWSALWLTGQFEKALEYLWRLGDTHRTHAVHAALTCHQMGLIASPQNINEKLISHDTADPKLSKRLNVARMVIIYTSKFECCDPREALNYYHAIRTFRTGTGESVLPMCVTRLVLQTKEYDLLLGRVNDDATLIRGLVHNYSFDSKKLIEYVANESENKGLMDVAVRLYDLSGNHDRCLSLLSSLLSQVAPQVSSLGSDRARYHHLAQAIGGRYKRLGCSASQATTACFFTLMDLVTVFDLSHSGKDVEALGVMRKVGLLPFESSEVDVCMRNFHMVPEEVRNVLGQLMVKVMQCVAKQHSSINDQQAQALLTNQAEALLLYAGMLPYRLPANVTSQLVTLESSMH